MAEENAPVPTAAPEVANEEQAPVTTANDETNANGEAPISKKDEVTAGKEATTEVNAPEGDGTAEAAAGPSAIEDEAETPNTKDKKRKSTGGVPEHKSKKLNKKKSMPTLRLDAKPGDLYWARLKGYPPWPSVICDEQMLPETLLASRPVSATRPDGSLREDFQDGGKNAKDRTYPIMFLSTNEFAWLVNTSLTPLEPEECKKPAAKISKALQEAYDIAAETPDLKHFHQVLQQFQDETAAIEAEWRVAEAEAADKAAAKAEKAEKAAEAKEKKARKSKGGEDEADGDAPKSSKKRKKEADSDADGKGKKLPKITKLNAPKEPNGSSAKKAAPTKTKKKLPAPVSDDTAKTELTESQKLAQREKGVLYLRHRLQKAFLTRDVAPKEDEMASMNDFFQQLESYEELEPVIIRNTKIHKVLKGIVKLDTIPREDEFNFKTRSQAMLELWNKRMEADGESAAKAAEETAAPATNGDAAVKTKQEIETEEKPDGKVEETIEPKEEGVAAPAPAPTEDVKTELPATDSTAAVEQSNGDGDVTMADAESKPVEA